MVARDDSSWMRRDSERDYLPVTPRRAHDLSCHASACSPFRSCSPEPSAAQEPARAGLRAGRQRQRRLPEISVTVTRTAEPLDRVPVRGRRPGPGRPSARPADHRTRRSAEQSPGRRGGQPLQLLARSAHLDPGLRQPVELRRARPQDPARWRATDAARRPEPAHQRRVRHDRPGRSPPRRQLRALRQRVRRRGLAPDRAGGGRARSRPGSARKAAPAKRGDDDFYKWQSWSSGRSGNASGTLSLSQFKTDGYRQHSAAEIRQLNAGVDYAFSGTTLGTLRFSAADDPTAENPGALTLAEYLANPDSAAGNNIPRRADKDVQQQQLSLGLKHVDAAGNELAVTVFGVLPRPEEPARRTAAERSRPDHRHVRGHRPRRGRRPSQRQPHARIGRACATAHRGRRRAADAR